MSPLRASFSFLSALGLASLSACALDPSVAAPPSGVVVPSTGADAGADAVVDSGAEEAAAEGAESGTPPSARPDLAPPDLTVAPALHTCFGPQTGGPGPKFCHTGETQCRPDEVTASSTVPCPTANVVLVCRNWTDYSPQYTVASAQVACALGGG